MPRRPAFGIFRSAAGFARRRAGDSTCVTLVGWLWLGSPFALIGVISHDRRLLAQVAAHYTACMAIGWTGAATMLLGVMVIPDPLGPAMFWIGTPLSGLAVFLRRGGDDGGGGEDPDVPPVDWGEFERSFWAYVRRGGRTPRPRTPAPH